MVANVGEVQAVFTADNVQFLKAARENVEAMKRQRLGFEQVAKAARTFVTAFTPVGRLLTKIRVATVASAVAVGLLTRNYVRASRRASDFGAGLLENARRTGLQVEQLQALNAVFESEGASSEDFIRGYRRFQRAIQDAQDGLSTQLRAFRRLGIEVDSYNFTLATTYEQLLLVADGLEGLSTTAQSATLQQLGLGPSLQAALQQGPQAFVAEYTRQLELLPPLTEEQTQNLKDLNQAFTDLSNFIDNRLNRLLANLAPLLTTITNAFTGLLNAITNPIDTLGSAITAPFRAIGDTIRSLSEFFSQASASEANTEAADELKEAAQALKDSARAFGSQREGFDFRLPDLENQVVNVSRSLETLTELIRQDIENVPPAPLDRLIESPERFIPFYDFGRFLERIYTRFLDINEFVQLRDSLFSDTEQAGEDLVKAITRFSDGLTNAINPITDRLEQENNRLRLQQRLDQAPTGQDRANIRFREVSGETQERILQLDLQVQQYQRIIDQIVGAGILSPEQERQLLTQADNVRKNAEALRKSLSEGVDVTRELLEEQEEYNSNLIELNARTTASQEQANQAVRGILERVISSRDSLIDQLALQEADTVEEQVAARLAPYVREYDKLISVREREIETLNQQRRDAIENREGEAAIVGITQQIVDVRRALVNLEGGRDIFISETRQGILETLELLGMLEDGADGAAGSVGALNGALQGFDFEGFLRSNSDYIQGLREQNEEIGQSVVGLAGLQAERSAEAFVQQEARRLNVQLTRSYEALAQAKLSGNEEAVANALLQVAEAKNLNEEFRQQLDLINQLIAKNREQAEEQAQAGIELAQLEEVAQGLGRAFGEFTGNVIRNFNDIGSAARRLGQQIVDSLINSLIVSPVSRFFTDLIGGGLGIPRRQNGGFTNRGLTLVGEAGPELVDFRNPGRVYSNVALANALSGAGRGDIVFAPVIQSSDSAAVNRALAEAYPIFENRVLSTIQLDARRNSGLRQSLRG